MSSEVHAFDVLVLKGSTPAAPQISDLVMPPRLVRRIEAVIPSGVNGVLGFALGATGVQIVPVNTGEWIISSDEKLGWDLSNLIESGAWQLIAYNTGAYDHTIYLRFLVDIPDDPRNRVTTPAAPADVSQLTSYGAAEIAALVADANAADISV